MLPPRTRLNDRSKLAAWLVTTVLGVVIIALAVVALGAWSAQASTPNQAQGQKAKGASTSPDTAAVVPAVQEGFEQGSLVYTQFTQAIPTCVPGGCGWTVVTTDHHTGSHSVHAPDAAGTGDQQVLINSPMAIPANATSAGLTFWQRYDFEAVPGHAYDGGVLELSTDGGATWVNGGALLTSSPYNRTLEAGTTNPLAGRPGWGGSLGGSWVQVQANLLIYRGASLLFRLRLGTDSDNSAGSALGWWVDDVVLSYQASAPCSPAGWLQAAPYPVIMADTAVASQGNLIFSFGGLNATINTASYRYDPGTNVWSPIAPLPAARYLASAASDGTYIYVIGGRDASISPTNTVYRYDPIANTYSTLAPVSVAVYEAGVGVLGGNLYRIGGKDASNAYLTGVEAFSLATHVWSPVASLPQGGGNQAVLPYGNYLYVAGGETGSGAATAKTYRYDPASNTWDDAAIPDLPMARTGLAAALYNGRWLFAGGISNGSGYLNSALAWDPASNSWSSRAQMPLPHGAAQGASAGGSFYAPGGVDAQSFITTTVYVYSETSCGPPTPTPTVCPIQFTDVPQASTFYPYVRCLVCGHIVSGYATNPPCTTGIPCFQPGSNITRGQLAKFISNAANYQDAIPPTRQTFTDVPPSSTFWLYIERAYLHAVVNGYTTSPPCTTGTPCFLPDANVTRGQTAKFESNAANFQDTVPPGQQVFTDVPNSNPFWLYVERTYLNGVIGGYTTGPPCTTGSPCFLPNNNVTRAQTAKFISNAFFPSCQTP